jgi:hypothetical protein
MRRTTESEVGKLVSLLTLWAAAVCVLSAIQEERSTLMQ